MKRQELKQNLVSGMFLVASKINEVDSEMGHYALRKAGKVTADMPMVTLVRTGDDIMMIAKKVGLDL